MGRTATILAAALTVSDRIAAGDRSWPEVLVHEFGAAVGTDTVGYAEGLQHGLDGYSVNTGGPPLSTDERAMWGLHWAEYPFFSDLLSGEIGAAVRSSDRIPSRSDFRRTVIYAEHFGPRDAEHQANFGLVCDGGIAIVGLYRQAHDFTVAEVEALERSRALLVHTLTYRSALDVVERLAGSGGTDPMADLLTQRQRAVLALIATGATDRTVARRLGISERTVRKHLDDIRRRLRVNSRVGAARWYADHQKRWSPGPSSGPMR